MTHHYLREAHITYRRTDVKLQARRISASTCVGEMMRQHIGSNMVESMVVIAIDAGNRVLGIHEVGRGCVEACPVRASDVFRYPLTIGAAGIILAHNHPSGRVDPSADDILLTQRIVEAGQLLGMPVLDHVIVTDTETFGFLDSGMLPKPKGNWSADAKG